MRPVFESIFADASNSLLEEIHSESIFDVGDPLAYQFIEKRTNQLAHNVTDTTYRAIQRQLNAERTPAGGAQ